MRGGTRPLQWVEHQTAAILAQAAPVQNTYYTILPTTRNIEIISWCIQVDTINESLQALLEIDGVIITSAPTACNAGTTYYVYLEEDISAPGLFLEISTTVRRNYGQYMIKGKEAYCRVQKTTNNGAGTLRGSVSYNTRTVG